MRIKFLLNAPRLPIIYRHHFMALIKETLKVVDKPYKESLYPDKSALISKVVKPFCFSLRLPAEKEIKKEKITIDKNHEIEDIVFYFPENVYLSFMVSSLDYKFLISLYNGLRKIKTFQFNEDITLSLNKAFIVNEKPIDENSMFFKTLSPILIEDKKGNPLTPFDDVKTFNEVFNVIHDKICKNIRGKGLHKELIFTPVKGKIKKIKHTLREFREKTGHAYMVLTCFDGIFKLKGEPSDLQFLYQRGVGLRTGQGFGMIEAL